MLTRASWLKGVSGCAVFWGLWTPFPRRSFKRIILLPCRSTVREREFSGDEMKGNLRIRFSYSIFRPFLYFFDFWFPQFALCISNSTVRLSPLIESLGVLRPSDRDLEPSELGVLARRDSFFTLLRLELDFSRLSFFEDFLRSSLRDRLRRLRREEEVFGFSLVLDDLDFREDR